MDTMTFRVILAMLMAGGPVSAAGIKGLPTLGSPALMQGAPVAPEINEAEQAGGAAKKL